MKKSLIKNSFKSIIKTRRRFISILVMAFLGVGFYSGLVATGPDMLDTLNRYMNDNKVFDIDVVSTLGLKDEDIKSIEEIPEIENVYGIQTKDSICSLDEKESIVKVIEYNENINVPSVVYGRLPEKDNECLLDSNYTILDEDFKNYIGKTIILQNEDKNEDDNPDFKVKELKIVGIANSPLYISSERGNTSLGSGNIGFFIYTKDIIDINYYSEIGIRVKNAKNYVTNSEKYTELIDNANKKIEEIKSQREMARYNELKDKANEKVDSAQKEFDEKKQSTYQELEDAKTKLDAAKEEISSSERKINASEKKIKTEENKLEKQFKDAQNEINNAENKIKEKEAELKNGEEELQKNKKEAEDGIKKIDEGLNTVKENLEQLRTQKNQLQNIGGDTTQIDLNITILEGKQTSLETQKQEIQSNLQNAEDKITIGKNEIAKAKDEINKQKSSLESGKKTAYSKLNSGKKEISEGREKLQKAKDEINQKETEYEDGKKEAEKQLNEAQNKINEARDEINKIEKAKWYITKRADNGGYSNIFDAIKTMTNISKIFPMVFYLVAVLISLTSMTRMIEEERIEIGTLKSLGYNNWQIISKYILYASLACLIGGAIGMSVGFYLLPNIVWILYSLIYTVPVFYVSYRLDIGLMGLIIAVICIVGATIYVAIKELKQMPAVLMRPKPPKNGKRVLLERVTFIWKKLTFSKKVTIRNIFRYKKRAIMTIVGIAGCTGLMLTGFGIKDSVADIPDSQFGKIFTYDQTITLANTNGLDELEKYLSESQNIKSYCKLEATTGNIKNNNLNYDVTVFVPEDEEGFKKSCNLIDIDTKEIVNLPENGIIITDKIAEILSIKKGDEITFASSDNIEYTFKVNAIVENYVSHYVYMSKAFYEKNIKSYSTNMLLINTKDISEDERNKMLEDILKIDGVASSTVVTSLVKAISDMLKTMNYVVVILVVSSAMLAFVVLYNLANINIGERTREIATLKVLGFFDKEVDNYINKENIIFTIIGVLLGMIFGAFLTTAIVQSVEIDKLRFIKNIKPISYIYSAIITWIFSFIVNSIIHFVLKKIDMIESLKSVE